MKDKGKRHDVSLFLSISHWRSQFNGCRFGIIASIILLAGGWVFTHMRNRSLSEPKLLGSYFLGSSGIVIRESFPNEPERRVRITNSREIAQILRAIQANPTKDRVCANAVLAVIEHPRGNATIRFCNHSFVMTYRNRTETYRMAPELLKALQDAVKDQPDRWHFTGWTVLNHLDNEANQPIKRALDRIK